MTGTEPGQRPGHRVKEIGIRDPDQLTRRARRIGQRSQEVEDRPHGQLAPDRHHVPGRLMVGRSEHEPEPDLLDAARDSVRTEIDPGAERLQQIGRPGQSGGRAIAVLCHRASGSRRDQRRGGRDVERPPAAAGAGRV